MSNKQNCRGRGGQVGIPQPHILDTALWQTRGAKKLLGLCEVWLESKAYVAKVLFSSQNYTDSMLNNEPLAFISILLDYNSFTQSTRIPQVPTKPTILLQ